MAHQPNGAVLEEGALRCFTLADLLQWRDATDLNVLAAARKLLEDISDGALIALAQRDRDGAVLH